MFYKRPIIFIKKVVSSKETKESKIFDLIVLLLILISIITMSIETLPNLSNETLVILSIIEKICMSVFLTEYLLRIAFVGNRIKFIFSFYGMIDLLALIPMFLGSDTRSLRAFRFLRVFRIFKLFRYSNTIDRLKATMITAKEELIVFTFATFILLYITSFGIYFFEHQAQPENFASVFHAMWWSVATLTTVGYGDIYPITTGGKIFTFAILMIGLGIVSVPAGIIASALTKSR